MSIELLTRLQALGIELWREDDRLRCRAPRGVLTAELRAEIGSAKEALLAALASATAPSNEWPLSPAQQRFWFFEQFEEVNGLHNIPIALRVRGPLDLASLRSAIATVFSRHDALRAIFHDGADGPRQSFGAAAPDFVVEELGPGVGDSEVQRKVVEETRRPFDLRTGPLLRARLFRLSAKEAVVTLTTHHLVCDGWSVQVILEELIFCYEAHLHGAGTGLPAAPSYREFLAWQRSLLSSDAGETQLAYWMRQLTPLPPRLTLPVNGAPPSTASFAGGRFLFSVSAEQMRLVRGVGRTAGASVFMVVLAAFQTYLARICQQRDVAVGTAVSNRNRQEFERLVGTLSNMLVLRTNLPETITFVEAVGRAREAALDAYDHQDVPFERLVERLRPPRDMGATPIINVMFQLLNAPRKEFVTPSDVAISRCDVDLGVARLDLTLEAREAEGGLACAFEYRTDLFTTAMIERLARGFSSLLTAATKAPHSQLGSLPVAEGSDLSVVGAPAPRAPTADVLRAIAARCDESPDAVAVASSAGHVTFRELLRRASVMARALRAAGACRGKLVGLLLDRSPEYVVSVLGTLLTGAAFLPLDPAHPPDRLDYIVADASVDLIVTDTETRAPTSLRSAKCVSPNVAGDDVAVNRDLPVLSDGDLAYSIYTSGSTGRPKGVMVTHGGLAQLVVAQIDVFAINRASRLFQFASSMFDASVSEIFTALAAGATLWIPRPEERLPGPDLVELFALQAIGVVTLPPSLLAVLPDTPLPALRTLVSAGEACTSAVIERWAGGRRFVNAYGPTEVTVCATMGECTQPEPRPSMGPPLAGSGVYVLDAALRPLPVGVIGEICVGGGGVARGYIRHPDWTADRFVPDPFLGADGGRMYRTGDLGLIRGDGALAYAGRADDQAKIRGHRVELGEVEANIAALDGVIEAAVVIHSAAGGPQLLAFVVPDGPGRTPEAIRDALAKRVPSFMLPAHLLFVGALPRSPAKKIDRKALLESYSPVRHQQNGSRVAATDIERRLVEMWRRILRIDQVGVSDNFFALGGHSLLAVQLLAAVDAEFGRRPPATVLFEEGTIEALARAIENPGAGPTSDQRLARVRADAILDDAIRPHPRSGVAARSRRVLVTGATGYVGAFLIDELLRVTDARIVCPVRAGSRTEAEHRVRATLEKYGLWDDRTAARIEAVVGDLARSGLGMTPYDRDRLADDIDAIYHNGALVDFLRPYEDLRPTNVLGTVEMLRIACHSGTPFHHVSTLSVFGPASPSAIIGEDDEPRLEELGGGYSQSKWAAERLVGAAGQRGLPCTIYRLGAVMGHSRTRVGNSADFLTALTRMCISVKSVPDIPMIVDCSPVDYVVGGLVRLSLDPASAGRTYHLCNPHPAPVQQIARRMLERGVQVRLVPYAEWRNLVLGSDAVSPLVAMLPDDAPAAIGAVFSTANAVGALRDFPCPPVDELLPAYFQVEARPTGVS